eukprot:4026798-Pleurochrysis_carterae.AAC.1
MYVRIPDSTCKHERACVSVCERARGRRVKQEDDKRCSMYIPFLGAEERKRGGGEGRLEQKRAKLRAGKRAVPLQTMRASGREEEVGLRG